MDKSNLLVKLFPDTTVREVVKRVIKNNVSHAESMATNYSFLDENKEVIFASSGQMCFGSLYGYWQNHKNKAKYLSYLPKYSQMCKKETRLRWIELGQEMDILDDGISAKDIHTQGIIIDMTDPELTLGELYLKLTYVRWMREASVLVNNTIDLVDNAGRDFWAAATFCHAFNAPRVDHSLIPFKSGYPVAGNKPTIERDLGLVMRLHKVAMMPRRVDTRTVAKSLSENRAFHWQWQSTTIKPELNIVVKDRLMLLSSELHPLIYSGDVKKAKELVKTLEQGQSNVKFE